MLTLRFERDPDRLEGDRSAAEPTLVFPLQSTVLTLSTKGLNRRLDGSTFALIPAGATYALEVHSSVAPTLTLAISTKARDATRREYAAHFELATWEAVIGTPRLLPRTRWVDELANRYLFERQVHARHDSAAARFLETELTKELFFLGKEQLHRSHRGSQFEQPTDLLRAAQQHLEQHLFDTITVPQLARQCHTSESTLLRVFRRELGVAPIVYVRNRRLDEALLLLESRKYTVSEVAVRIGYANLSAFTVAFGRRFGVPPSEVKPKGGGASVLPPQGVAGTRKKMTFSRKRTRSRKDHMHSR